MIQGRVSRLITLLSTNGENLSTEIASIHLNARGVRYFSTCANQTFKSLQSHIFEFNFGMLVIHSPPDSPPSSSPTEPPFQDPISSPQSLPLYSPFATSESFPRSPRSHPAPP